MDAAQIAKIAEDNQAKLIIVGMPTGGEGEEIRQSRHSLKLIDMIQSQTTIPVKPWDETGSTQQAQQWLVEGGKARTKRVGHQDALAAAAILQNYLDAMKLIRADNNEKK
jgi:putative holliday junction resolvase